MSGLVGYWNAYRTVQQVVAPSAAPAAIAADAGPLSIVVLPFQNLTGDANQAYVADGLTASLTADLSRIRDAFIVSAASAFAYKDKPVTAQQVGRDLGVHFVLQGNVQRSGTKIRINAQLADAVSNAQLWSESFEGDQSDLFGLQDQVTARIGNSIGREMVIVAARESETHKSSPKVADLMLRALALDLKPQSLETLQRSEELYRQVLALEPNNSRAMVGLADSLALQASNFNFAMDDSVKEKKYLEAHDLALKAKEMDPEDPEVYTTIETYARTHNDYEGELRADEARLSLAPKDPAAYNNLAVALLYGGEPRRAIDLLTQAINLDPKRSNNDAFFLNIGCAYFMLGENDNAIKWLLESLEKNSAFPMKHSFLAMAYAVYGQDSKARAEAADLRRLAPGYKLSTQKQPDSSQPAAYKDYYEKKFVPAWRKAGLPE